MHEQHRLMVYRILAWVELNFGQMCPANWSQTSVEPPRSEKIPEGGLCTYHTSSVSSDNRILLGIRVAQEAGLEGSSPSRSDFCWRPCCLLALSYQANWEQKRENCGLLHLHQTVEPSHQEIILVSFTASGEKDHSLVDYHPVIVAVTA